MRWAAAFGVLALGVSVPLIAAENVTAGELWQGISKGDGSALLAEKLQAMPEIKAVKVKPAGRGDAKVSITYRADGIDILGEKFSVVPEMQGDQVQRIVLASGLSCMTNIEERYDRFLAAMSANYPELLNKRVITSDLRSAVVRATEAKPVRLATGLASAATVAVLVVEVTKKDPPPSAPFGATRSMRAAESFLWSEYNQVAEECDGTGAVRAAFRVIYMTREDHDLMVAEQDEARAKANQEAASKL